jgi:hypothetical protein
LTRYAGKPLKDWSNADLIDWANEKYPKVVRFLTDYDGLDLAGWRKEDFEKYLGGPYGASFYGHLLGAHCCCSTFSTQALTPQQTRDSCLQLPLPL